MTAVSTLRDDLTFYCEFEFKKICYVFLNSHFPILFQPFFPSASFYQKIQEFMQIQELSRISKVL